MLIYIIYILVLILLSAIFSGTETAFTSLTFMQEKELETQASRTGRLAARLSGQSELLLSTILIGNNLVNIGASALTTATVIQFYGNYAVGISTGLLTLVILIFAEITPKQVAIIHNETICRIMAFPMQFLVYLLYPISYLITLFSSLITKLFSGKIRYSISEKGILHAVHVAKKQGAVLDYETTFIQNVFRFNDVDVHTIMTHRTDVFSISEQETLQAVMPEVINSGYARIPVYGDSPEHITGILLTRDLLKYATKGEAERTVAEIIKIPIYVPESRKAHEMFDTFKENKLHMAVVLDEYGGLAGIVTMEDVIEELFGELYDEHEEGMEERILDLGNDSYRILGDTSIQQLEDVFGIDMEHSKHVGTIGGYITESLGTIPQQNEELCTSIGTFVVRKMRGNRIEIVIFHPAEDEEATAES